MSRHKAHASLGQMAEAIEAALEYLGDLDSEQLKADKMRRDAIVLNLQVVGEAARRVPPAIQQANPQIPWA